MRNLLEVCRNYSNRQPNMRMYSETMINIDNDFMGLCSNDALLTLWRGYRVITDELFPIDYIAICPLRN